MATKKRIALTAPVTITAAEQVEGEAPKPPTFSVVAYTGGAMNLNGWDMPVVVDLAGMTFGNSLIANLDHETSKRVGHVTEKSKADGQLVLSGIASAANPARDEVVNSAATGFVWQASIEAMPQKVVEVEAGKKVTVNGQEHTGPLYVARKSVLKGFAFVSHGADDNTSVSIAAIAKGNKMELSAEFKAWASEMGLDIEGMEEQTLKNLQADFSGKSGKRKIVAAVDADDPLSTIKAEKLRKAEINDIATDFANRYEDHADDIDTLRINAIKKKQSPKDFRTDLLEAMMPQAHTVFTPRRDKQSAVTGKIIEAAVAIAGRLGDDDYKVKLYGEQTLEAAEKQFKRGIRLSQIFLHAARANGYTGDDNEITEEVQNWAFGHRAPNIRASGGFSTVDIATILSNVANKFLREGWNTVDMTPMRIAAISTANDFKQMTTVSLIADTEFKPLGPAGEIRHGNLSELSYTNQVDTYGRMLAITRKDMIDDNLGALTSVPRKLGRGAALKLNDLFWTCFLDNSTFFSSGNANVSTDTGALGVTGLQQAEAVFMSQTDPSGYPLGITPSILLVPTALHNTARTLMASEYLIDGTATAVQGNRNVFAGRFRVESSPYMHNTAYTGYSSSVWYLLADPSVLPVIEIAALRGRVEPTVETAEAAFNVLGVQMRGYSDVGVALQEYRGGVRADGSAAG